MTLALLIPLGLLGLLGIVALIIIYIIKPNYLVKHVSSTYVWKLSLKYKRKKLPTSTIRNILLFICQVLILTAIALIFAKPAIVYDHNTDRSDVIAIIDSSASMYTETEETTRFERAVEGVRTLSGQVISEGGAMTVILADDKPEFLVRQVTSRNRSELDEALDALLADKNACFYGSSDMDAAITLCEDVLAEDPAAKIHLFTDTSYSYLPEMVTLEQVTDSEEWNAAILNARAELVDGYYALTAEVACYGRDLALEVKVEVNVPNSATPITFSKTVTCNANSTKTVIFRYGGGEESEDFFYYDIGSENRFTTYTSVILSLGEQDSFREDNTFYLYGGQKETIRVVYASSDPNPFFTGMIDNILKKAYSNVWDVRVDEVPKGQEFPTSGYNFYLYEHRMPEQIPMDGVVVLMDPDRAPTGADFRIQNRYPLHNPVYLQVAEDHPVLFDFRAEEIYLTYYTGLELGPAYKVLLTCDGRPVLALRNDGANKTAVLPFSVHYSNLSQRVDWGLLIYNLFSYYMPPTVPGNAYEVNEEITVDSRGPEVSLKGSETVFTEFPASLKFSIPGTYTLKQTSYYNETLPDVQLFVKIPALESNIWREESGLAEPYIELAAEDSVDDLLIWLAAALVALLFAEWWLQSRENR